MLRRQPTQIELKEEDMAEVFELAFTAQRNLYTSFYLMAYISVI